MISVTTAPVSLKTNVEPANEFAAWLEQLAQQYRDSAEIHLGGWGDIDNAWLGDQIAALATMARLVDAQTAADYDERVAALEAERTFALQHPLYAAELAGIDVQAQIDPSSLVD